MIYLPKATEWSADQVGSSWPDRLYQVTPCRSDMDNSQARAELTMFLTVRITMAAALASSPVPTHKP